MVAAIPWSTVFSSPEHDVLVPGARCSRPCRRFPISYFKSSPADIRATAVKPRLLQFFKRDGQRGIVENGLDPRKALGVAPNSLLGHGEPFVAVDVAGPGCAVGGGQLGCFRRLDRR